MNDQRSTTDQLRDVIQLATEAGMYDAADAITRAFFAPARTVVVTDPEDIARLTALRARLARDLVEEA